MSFSGGDGSIEIGANVQEKPSRSDPKTFVKENFGNNAPDENFPGKQKTQVIKIPEPNHPKEGPAAIALEPPTHEGGGVEMNEEEVVMPDGRVVKVMRKVRKV